MNSTFAFLYLATAAVLFGGGVAIGDVARADGPPVVTQSRRIETPPAVNGQQVLIEGSQGHKILVTLQDPDPSRSLTQELVAIRDDGAEVARMTVIKPRPPEVLVIESASVCAGSGSP